VGSRSNRVTAGFIGGGGTDKATRPTGVLTLTRQKEPSRGIPPKPSFPDRQGCTYVHRSLPARTSGTNTRRSPGLSVALGLSGASPLAHSRPQLSQVSARSLCGVAFGRPITSARRAHDSCSVCVPAHQARSSARQPIMSHGLGSRVKTKPLRRRVSLGLDPSARHAREVPAAEERDSLTCAAERG
jgi:hypothetical protein